MGGESKQTDANSVREMQIREVRTAVKYSHAGSHFA